MNFRKEADYASIYDEKSAEIALDYAVGILKKTKVLMKSKKEKRRN